MSVTILLYCTVLQVNMLELWLHLCSLVASCQSESCLYLFHTPLLFHMFSLSYIWGSIADSKGRKPVIVTSAILTGAASVAFGFSTTFAMAVILRFFVGFLNGTPHNRHFCLQHFIALFHSREWWCSQSVVVRIV